MQTEKIEEELSNLWRRYQEILDNPHSTWEDINEARAILFITGDLYLGQISTEAIERRLKFLKERLTIVEFLHTIDSNSARLKELRKCPVFRKLETYYRIIKKYKNIYKGGKFYLDEERFIQKYNKLNPDKKSMMGYRGHFDRHFLN